MVTPQFLSSFEKQQLRTAQRLSQVSRPFLRCDTLSATLDISQPHFPMVQALTESKFKHDSYPPHKSGCVAKQEPLSNKLGPVVVARQHDP
mmetsp:Transcript_27144/g.39738  ORF Transcript_27144/g.39738 Transcript_27144/m.39738 type:complete len:91 (-) Transcript_27144:229-501(-)